MVNWLVLYITAGVIATIIMVVAACLVTIKSLGMSRDDCIKQIVRAWSWREIVKTVAWILGWPVLVPVGIWSLITTTEFIKDMKKFAKEL